MLWRKLFASESRRKNIQCYAIQVTWTNTPAVEIKNVMKPKVFQFCYLFWLHIIKKCRFIDIYKDLAILYLNVFLNNFSFIFVQANQDDF